ncbi:MAG: site-specific integrase [Oscillospiraceae bacterium]
MGERRKYVRRDATVGRLSAIFLEDMEGSVKPSTLACYRRNIQCHILPALGARVAAEVTVAEINDYIQQLQEDYSPKLVREIGGLLLRIVGMAGVGYGEDVTLPKVRQKAVEVFTEPELKQMGQVILRRPDRTGLGVLLTAYTGLRLGELCGLQWQDVDVGAGLLHIQRTVERISQTDGGTCLTVQPPKTENSERWIPIPKEMLRMLKPETKQPDSYLLTGGESSLTRGRCSTAIRCCWSAAACGIGISIACGIATPRGVWSAGWT